jgi:carbamoyl-phosphate synthase small subunit
MKDILAWKPDGVLLGNGPGDPGAMPAEVAFVKELLKSGLPVFGICLGHQLLAQAMGIGTEKMHHGHRGINHPVRNLITGKDEVTSQNHGFVVSKKEAEGNPEVIITHIHLNDGSVAGHQHQRPTCFQRAKPSRSRPRPTGFAVPLRRFHG